MPRYVGNHVIKNKNILFFLFRKRCLNNEGVFCEGRLYNSKTY